MNSKTDTVTVEITNGPSIDVNWFSNMNAQQAIEGAFNQQTKKQLFKFALEYYGSGLGYLIIMIDNIFETTTAPYKYWEFFVNGVPAQMGIDNTVLNLGDVITFTYETYQETKHKDTTVGAKHSAKLT